eukprot:scaffold310_cov174-Ochromonas_danica.AAC.6
MQEAILNNTDSYSIRYNYLLQLKQTPYDAMIGVPYAYDNQKRIKEIPTKYLDDHDRHDLYYVNACNGSASNTSTLPLSCLYFANMDNSSACNCANITYSTHTVFTRHYFAMYDAELNILLTVFVAVMMVLGAIIFTLDVERLVLIPIARMMNMVEAVAENPLAPIATFTQNKNDKFLRRSNPSLYGSNSSIRLSIISSGPDDSIKVSRNNSGLNTTKKANKNGGNKRQGEYEMKLLENTIEKVTGLLRVGFGEAGAGIISANLSRFDRSIMIDPLLPGIRVYAVFGFCDIHRFEEVTRKLGKDVLLFVNTIAEIVHSQTHEWGGQCNKNLGNAFIIVWRIGDEETLVTANSASILSRVHHMNPNGGGGGEALVVVPAKASKGMPLRRDWSSSCGEESDEEKSTSSDAAHRRFSSGGSPAPAPAPAPSLGTIHPRSNSVYVNNYANTSARSTIKTRLVDLRRVAGTDEIANQALIAFLKVIAEINRSPPVLQYRRDARLRARTSVACTVSPARGFGPGSNTRVDSDGHVLPLPSVVLASPTTTRKTLSVESCPLPAKNKPVTTLQKLFPSVEDFGQSKKEETKSTPSTVQQRLSGTSATWNMPQCGSQKPPRPPNVPVNHTPKEFNFMYTRRSYYQNLFHKYIKTNHEEELGENSNEKEDFRVRMGFGLHAGWAIEGAVGSIYKVDATYLSPHVNLTARLQTACRQYGVGLLMSQHFHDLLSSEAQIRCRKIDRVTVKGSEMPIAIYTYDTLQEQIFCKQNQQQPRRGENDTVGGTGTVAGVDSGRDSRKEAFDKWFSNFSGHSRPAIQKMLRRKSNLMDTPMEGMPSGFLDKLSHHRSVDNNPPTIRRVSIKPDECYDKRESVDSGEDEVKIDSGASLDLAEGAASPLDDHAPVLDLKQLNVKNDADENLNRSSIDSNSTSPTRNSKKKTMLSVLDRGGKILQKRFSLLLSSVSKDINLDQSSQHSLQLDALSERDRNSGLHSLSLPDNSMSVLDSTQIQSVSTHDDFTEEHTSGAFPAITFSKREENQEREEEQEEGKLNAEHKEDVVTSRVDDDSGETLTKLSTDDSNLCFSPPGNASERKAKGRAMPIPPFSDNHPFKIRLQLSNVHKEMLRSHRVYVRKMQRLLATSLNREHDDYILAMRYLNNRFPNAALISSLDDAQNTTMDVFGRDVDLSQLQVHVTQSFLETFADGLSEYLKGHWVHARALLMDSDRIMRQSLLAFEDSPLCRHSPGSELILGDGPSRALLSYMKECNFVAPSDWRGFRTLTSK